MQKSLALCFLAFILAAPLEALAAPKAIGKASITSVCSRRQTGGWLYKPESDDTGDRREGKPVMLYTKYKPKKGSIRIYARNGTPICSFKYYKGAETHGRRFYAGTGCGMDGSALARAARRVSGSSRIYIEGDGGNCAGPIDSPTSRTDRR